MDRSYAGKPVFLGQVRISLVSPYGQNGQQEEALLSRAPSKSEHDGTAKSRHLVEISDGSFASLPRPCRQNRGCEDPVSVG